MVLTSSCVPSGVTLAAARNSAVLNEPVRRLPESPIIVIILLGPSPKGLLLHARNDHPDNATARDACRLSKAVASSWCKSEAISRLLKRRRKKALPSKVNSGFLEGHDNIFNGLRLIRPLDWYPQADAMGRQYFAPIGD